MIEITFKIDELELPDHNYQHLIEWVKFEVGQTCSVRLLNPLSTYSLKDFNGEFVSVKEVSK